MDSDQQSRLFYGLIKERRAPEGLETRYRTSRSLSVHMKGMLAAKDLTLNR